MKKNLLTAILTICLAILLCGLLPIHGEEKIYNSVIRLHVLANSDSEEDQAVKLKVRDAILEESNTLFAECTDRQEAIAKANESLARIEKIATDTVRAEGYDHSVRVVLDTEEYPTRNYESMSFPSGEYLSLRVLIGEGKGQNWWCVLFPPLCLDAATEVSPDDAFISVGLNAEEYRIITETDKPKYQVRFKILETIEDLVS